MMRMMMASMTRWCVFISGCLLVIVASKVCALSEPGIQDDVRFQHPLTTKGRKFVFAFMDNCLHAHTDVEQGPKLTITARPDGAPSVQINVSMPLLGFFESVSVAAGSQVNVQLPPSAIAHGLGLHENGVGVDASDDVFVYGIAEEDRHAKTEGFLALPVPEPTSSEYKVVSMEQKKGNTRRHSTFAVVGFERSWVSIDAVATVTYENITYQPGETINVFLDPYQVIQIKSLDDLTGTRVHSTSPVGFMSGVDCGTMKLRHSTRSGCGHMVEQLPRTKDWGKHFIYRTLSGGPNTRRSRYQTEPVEDVVTRIRIIPAEEDTHVVYGTDKERVGNDLDFVISGGETVHITALKPVLVVAFILYHGACDRGCKKRSPTMVTIPPLAPPTNDVIFSTVNATDRSEDAEMFHFMSVMYDCACFRRLTWENPSQTEVISEGLATINNQICWNQFRLTPGRYHLTVTPDQTAPPCILSAFLFGHGTNGGYAFPLGLDRANAQPAERPMPTSAIGSEFFIAFAAYFRGNRRGPKLLIHRASPAEDIRPIHGQIDAGAYSRRFVIPIGTPNIEIELPTEVVLYDTRDESANPVEVRTQGQVLLYGLNDAFSDERSDAYLALPTPMMGQEYRLVTSHESTMFVIIGLHDDTFVDMRLRGSLWFRNHVHYGGTRVGFKINRHQTFFFMSVEDQTGTHIVASKPISVLSGALCGHSYYPDQNEENDDRCGHKLEHIPPVERWGRRFVASAMRGYDGGDVSTYVMASHMHTNVRINDDDNTVHIPPGQVYRVYQGDTGGLHTLITSRILPVLVFQVPNSRNLTQSTGFSLPSLTLVPSVDEPIEDVQSSHWPIPLATFNLRHMNTTTSFANVVAPCLATSNITLNGDALEQSEWSGPVANSDLCVMQKQLKNSGSNHLDTGGAKVSAVLYGFSPASAYTCPGTV